MYQEKTAHNKTLLMRRLVNHKLRSGMSITEHASQFQDLVNQLGAADWVLKDEEQAILLLSSLPDNWETLVVTLSNSDPSGKVTMEMVSDALMNEEARRKEVGTAQSFALVSENKERGRGRTGGRGRGRGRGRHSQSRGRSQDRGKSRDRGKSQERGKSSNTWFKGYCNHCNYYGHKRSDCRRFLREQLESSQNPSRENGETMVTITQDVALVTYEEEAWLHVGTHDDEWVIDSAASYHSTPNRDLFTTYKPGDHGTVKMGNTIFSSIADIGDVHLKTNVGCTLVLKDVRHVPELRLNLISVRALDAQGYDSQFKNGTWKLLKGAMVVARGQLYGTLYKSHAKLLQPSLNAVEEEISPNLWHRRLGHMSEKGLATLAKKESISIAKDVALDPCEYCLFGKQHRVSLAPQERTALSC